MLNLIVRYLRDHRLVEDYLFILIPLVLLLLVVAVLIFGPDILGHFFPE